MAVPGRALAREGLIAIAACWFSGGGGAGARFVTPLACPDARPISDASSTVAMRTVDALVLAARTLPDVRADRIGLFGHSRGGGAAWNYVVDGNRVQAAVLNSARISQRPRRPLTSVQMARNFEAALRRANKAVEANYYDGAGHNGIFKDATQREDEVRRMGAFFRHYLRD